MVSIGVALVSGGPKGSLRLVTVEEGHVLTVYMSALGPFWLQLPTMWQKETVIKNPNWPFFFFLIDLYTTNKLAFSWLRTWISLSKEEFPGIGGMELGEALPF